MKKVLALLVLAVCFIGCQEKTIDSTTDETLKSSIEEMKKSLNEERKKEFDKALLALTFSGGRSLIELARDPEAIKNNMKKKLHGKTVDEIILSGNKLIAERREKEKQQALIEIEEVRTQISQIEQKRSQSELAKNELKQIVVSRSRFYIQKKSFLDEAIIELTVQNNTQHAVSRVFFEGVLSSPGRSVPWVKDTFNYKIPGGLEPGEKATWKLAPNRYGEWRNAPKDRKDTILSVMVTRVDNAEGEPLYDSEFSQHEITKLEDLKKRLAGLKKAL